MKKLKIVCLVTSLVLILLLCYVGNKIAKERSFKSWVRNQGGTVKAYYPKWMDSIPSFLAFSKDCKVNSYSVSFRNSNVTDISTLRGMKKVKYLDLSFTKITDFGVLKTLENLSVLSLDNVSIQDLSLLSNLNQLRDLNLCNLAHAETNDPMSIRLVKANPPIKDISLLQNLTNLEVLRLDGSDITSIEHLVKFKKLILLSLILTKLSPEQGAELKKALPQCVVVTK